MKAVPEDANEEDPFSVALYSAANQVVGHMPREISRCMHYFLKRDGKLKISVLSTKRRRSPIMQGGLEILISAEASSTNDNMMKKLIEYLEINNSHYTNIPDITPVTELSTLWKGKKYKQKRPSATCIVDLTDSDSASVCVVTPKVSKTQI